MFPPPRKRVSGHSNEELVTTQQEPKACAFLVCCNQQHFLGQSAASAPPQKVPDNQKECLFHFFILQKSEGVFCCPFDDRQRLSNRRMFKAAAFLCMQALTMSTATVSLAVLGRVHCGPFFNDHQFSIHLRMSRGPFKELAYRFARFLRPQGELLDAYVLRVCRGNVCGASA